MILTLGGLIAGIGAILLGNFLEGGHISSLIQPTAALIVGGGTLGATMLSSQMGHFAAAIKDLKGVFFPSAHSHDEVVKEILALATSARKEGILALDAKVKTVHNPFLKQYLRPIIDGFDPEVLKATMEDNITHREHELAAIAKVWETAGGFSPTVGIIGAVMGLIHVMSNLSDSSKLGSGIAVAFVATVYGVGAANLVMLPIANQMKGLAKNEIHALNLVYTGLVGIQAGLNPRVIETRLKAQIGEEQSDGEEPAKKAA